MPHDDMLQATGPLTDPEHVWQELGAMRVLLDQTIAQVRAMGGKIDALPAEMDARMTSMMATIEETRERRLADERVITKQAIAVVEAAIAPVTDVIAYMETDKAERKRTADLIAAAHAREEARYKHMTNLLHGMAPFFAALLAVVLAGAWQHLADVPGPTYWGVVVGVLLIAALFYVYLVERERRGGGKP